ncbi:conserved hypothetical protein [Pediculus humanus corporis]|uniref:Receptor-binding cancer antigen expressed on SiSo cells n=1 Tax=Pediculus humanus subsp. corporis TaxID=121224 RepID=E0VEB1_PEDHC|nr:uncharacterized protein Phum_PHUM129500 [Pediculus humanus corporis]EEB11717.1 conserved hypothetical protein [Pediculus humanus corporis]
MVNFIKNSILALFQFVIRIFKKAVCCFRRRRRLSGDSVTLTNIGIVPNVEKDSDLQTWNSWDSNSIDKSPTMITTVKPIDPVQQQIELYRQQRINLAQNEDIPETKIDYFQDMTPKIVRQAKMYLPSENEESINSYNFSLAPDPAFKSSELGIWEENQTWEDQTEQDWDANDMIREKKKVDREERLAKQQKKKMERKARLPIGVPS